MLILMCLYNIMRLICIIYLHIALYQIICWKRKMHFFIISVQVCRETNDFFTAVVAALPQPQRKNVEWGGRDRLKTFRHGVCAYFIPKPTRINGGWWISIARQLRIFFCFTPLISDGGLVLPTPTIQYYWTTKITEDCVFKYYLVCSKC